MIKRGISSAQRRHRLPEQSRVPNTPDLEYLFTEASKQPGHLVELPWTHNRQQFVLTAKLERRNNEQSHQWSFYRGDGQDSKLEWAYETSDVVMIHSLVMTAFPPEPVAADPAALAALHPSSQQSTQPQSDSGPRKIRDVLEGNLADMPLPSLLTSIQSSRLTGKLAIHERGEETEMFFHEGHLLHVRRPNMHEGEDAFFETFLNSVSGDFKFVDSETSTKRTIKEGTESLMLKAAALSDHAEFLNRQGLKLDSCLVRTTPDLSEKEFEGRLANLVPVDMNLQKRMYQAIDHSEPFEELLKKCSLSRSLWTPLIFNLVSSGLVNIQNKSIEDAPVQPLDQTGSHVTIDLAALEKFTTSMTRKDSGIYTEIAFLFFLEHEFYRYHSYETPFTLALFKFERARGQKMSKDMLKSILEVVKNTVRKADILGHYEGDDYALILPHTDPRASQGLVHRLRALIQEPPFPPNDVMVSIGLAGIPEDCQDLMSLLKIARHRKKHPN